VRRLVSRKWSGKTLADHRADRRTWLTSMLGISATDGKTENAQHVLVLDPFTLAVLKAHVEQLKQERRDFGPEYHDHDILF
jgi:hypothetical protein